MKVLALMTGRPKGISEALAKEALLGAKENGAEVEIINLFHTKIESCIGCSLCSQKGGGRGGAAFQCFRDDDFNFVADHILESDAIIVVMPMYEKFAPGVFKTMCDRIGPYFDVAFAKKHKELIAKGERPNAIPPDERLFKTRPVAFVAHGGSEWTTLGLATTQIFSISLGLKTVYRKNIDWDSDTWARDERFDEMRRMGAHVAACAGKPEEEMAYIGEPGHCPVCHNDVLLLGAGRYATCAVCGLEGELKDEESGLVFFVEEKDLYKSHCTLTGKQIHDADLDKIMSTIMSLDKEQLKRRKDAMDWIDFTKPSKK